MSYDIDIVRKRSDIDLWYAPNDLEYKDFSFVDYSDVPHTNGGMINITSNLASMFDSLPIGYLPDNEGKKLRDLIPKLTDSIIELNTHPEEYKKYEAPNGWGTIKGAKRFLWELNNLCLAYPDCYLVVDR